MSQSSSAGSSRQGGRGNDGRGSPIAYRTPPLGYQPAVFYDCTPRLKAKQWISWSELMPGRRYLRCQNARGCYRNALVYEVQTEKDCKFYRWVDEEPSPWYKLVLGDLRDRVWSLKDDLGAREGDVEALSNHICGLEIELDKKMKEIDEKQLELEEKQQEVDVKEQELHVKQEELHVVQQELLDKQEVLVGKDLALVAMESKLKNKNQCIDALVVMCLFLVVILVVLLMK